MLASGAMSSVKVDIEDLITKRGVHRYITDFVVSTLSQASERFKIDSVGGPAIGAIPLACGLADRLDADWFYLDKAGSLVAPPSRSSRVLLIDDVITSGGSLLRVADELERLGVHPVCATAVLDRGDVARARFESRGIEYFPILTHDDLGLEAIDASVTTNHRAYAESATPVQN
jgi:orotate phosphoribosyltransferase